MVHESQVFSSSGAMAVGLLAFFAEDWYNFQGMCAIALFLLCIVAFFVPESPRWVGLHSAEKFHLGPFTYEVHSVSERK